MRPGRFREMSYQEVLDHYQLILCADPKTCKRRISVHKHTIGTFDGMGHIHWSRADTKVTRRGMRSLLVAVAGVMLKHSTSKAPEWEKLYEANLWAWREGMQTWHVQFTQEMSKKDRLKAARLAAAEPVRVTNFAAYQWMRGRRKKWHQGHTSSGTRSSATSLPSSASTRRRLPVETRSLVQSA